jgi:RNA polymerase sigma-70 factor (ECF subfamily)
MPLGAAATTRNPADEELALIHQASRGDRAAFGELYSRYARTIHGILLARVPVSDAEDLVQEVFVSAFRRLGSLRDPAAFRGWLATIARNHAVEFYRSTRLREAAPLDRHEGRPAGHDDALMVLDAVRKLPEAYRETLILRLVEGMTGPEIADRTGLTPDSVRVNLFRGMKMLRRKLGGKEEA